MILDYTDELYNRRMTKASCALVIRLPFFGYLLFGSAVKVTASLATQTLGTDGVNIFCGVGFVKTEGFDILMFGLLHELLHVYFNHHARRESRDPKLWNIAADIYTNMQCSELLATENQGKPVLWVVPDRFIQWQGWAKDMTVEQIYVVLKKQEEEDPDSIKQYLPGSGESAGEISNGSDMVEPESPPPTCDGMAGAQADPDFQSTFRQDVARAKSLSEQSPLHRPLSESIRSRMDKLMRPTLPWGSLVRGQLADDLGWDEASYAPPKMKYYPIILPQTRMVKERKLVLGIDVSASVTQELIRIFGSNVESAASRATEIIIVTFDAVVREVFRTKRAKDIFNHITFKSGHHTSTSAMGLFDIVKEEKPSAICILTDGHITIPETPVRNTTYVIPEGGNVLPWGKTFVMEHPWR